MIEYSKLSVFFIIAFITSFEIYRSRFSSEVCLVRKAGIGFIYLFPSGLYPCFKSFPSTGETGRCYRISEIECKKNSLKFDGNAT